MDKSNKRGKIPQTDWPLIMARYDAGETLASIARTYDCSPPAISYVVSRNRDKPANETSSPPALEPQLLKAHSNGSPLNSAIAPVEPKVAPAPVPAAVVPFAEARPHRNDAERASAPIIPAPGPAQRGNGEQQRPKLHLGFGSGNGPGNGHGPGNGGPQPQAQPAPQLFQAPPRDNPFDNGPSNRDFAAMREPRPPNQMAPQMPRDEPPARKNGGAALDQELRSRVDGDISAFLAAFDAVLEADSHESRFSLKEATDRLLRAGARTRIELERLEARVPLTPREGQAQPAGWRYR